MTGKSSQKVRIKTCDYLNVQHRPFGGFSKLNPEEAERRGAACITNDDEAGKWADSRETGGPEWLRPDGAENERRKSALVGYGGAPKTELLLLLLLLQLLSPDAEHDELELLGEDQKSFSNLDSGKETSSTAAIPKITRQTSVITNG
ncbi:hypothetical protein Q1695_011133 [Nippostrongylus brasiliensis]|nr:hypothetical protein Q1695_011133 [Nippostrongylus brasiliensis]